MNHDVTLVVVMRRTIRNDGDRDDDTDDGDDDGSDDAVVGDAGRRGRLLSRRAVGRCRVCTAQKV